MGKIHKFILLSGHLQSLCVQGCRPGHPLKAWKDCEIALPGLVKSCGSVVCLNYIIWCKLYLCCDCNQLCITSTHLCTSGRFTPPPVQRSGIYPQNSFLRHSQWRNGANFCHSYTLIFLLKQDQLIFFCSSLKLKCVPFWPITSVFPERNIKLAQVHFFIFYCKNFWYN